MIRARFRARVDDPRPVEWPVKHPYWVTGEDALGRYAVVVSYGDDVEYIKRLWPEAEEIEVEEVEGYEFTDRFERPGWFKGEDESTKEI